MSPWIQNLPPLFLPAASAFLSVALTVMRWLSLREPGCENPGCTEGRHLEKVPWRLARRACTIWQWLKILASLLGRETEAQKCYMKPLSFIASCMLEAGQVKMPYKMGLILSCVCLLSFNPQKSVVLDATWGAKDVISESSRIQHPFWSSESVQFGVSWKRIADF